MPFALTALTAVSPEVSDSVTPSGLHGIHLAVRRTAAEQQRGKHE